MYTIGRIGNEVTLKSFDSYSYSYCYMHYAATPIDLFPRLLGL